MRTRFLILSGVIRGDALGEFVARDLLVAFALRESRDAEGKLLAIIKASAKLATLTDIRRQREQFAALSANVERFLEIAGTPAGTKVYKAFCPMAFDNKGASWLQADQEIMNPYFGAAMLHCGEIQKTLGHNAEMAAKQGLSNIRPILGDQRTTNLPDNATDLVITIRTYHHFEHPEETLASISAALRPGGRFVVSDYERIRGVTIPEDYEHMRAGKGTFSDEIVDAGFVLTDEIPLLPDNFYFLVFEKR